MFCNFISPVLEKTPESPLDSKEIKPVNRKGSQPWILIGRTDAEPEAPILWQPNANSQLILKVPDAGKDWGQKEKKASEDEMDGQHHWYNGHEPGQAPGDGEGQGGLVCCSPWGRKEADTTGCLNNIIQLKFQNKMEEHIIPILPWSETISQNSKQKKKIFQV